MRARLLIAFALGVVLGGGAVWLAAGPGEPRLPGAAAGDETVRILVARRVLAYGKQIEPDDLQWVEWPKGAVPPGSFTSVEALLGEKGDAMRVVLRTIEPGEPLLENKISGLGESPPALRNLGEGRRAVPIRVDPSAGVAGFLAPGDRVDIMLIRRIEGELVTSIIMQDVPVLAVEELPPGRRRGEVAARTVIVETDLHEAQQLALAQQVGRLSVTLRGLGDDAPRGRPAPRLPRSVPERCKRPWSGYRGFREDILIPDLCRSALDGVIGPALGPSRPPVRLRRGDWGVPRGLDAPRHPAEEGTAPPHPPAWPWQPPRPPHG